MSRQAHAGKTLIDVRRLAAIDIYGRHGSKRRRRLILAEFVLGAIDIPLLGLTLVLAASSVPRVLLGAYLIGLVMILGVAQFATGRRTPSEPPTAAQANSLAVGRQPEGDRDATGLGW